MGMELSAAKTTKTSRLDLIKDELLESVREKLHAAFDEGNKRASMLQKLSERGSFVTKSSTIKKYKDGIKAVTDFGSGQITPLKDKDQLSDEVESVKEVKESDTSS